MPYNWELIKIYEGTALDMSKLEYTLNNKYKEQSYVPIVPFGGRHECFNICIDLNSC